MARAILPPLASGMAAASVFLRLWLLPQRLTGLMRNGLRDWLVLVVPSIALVVLLAAMATPGTSWTAAMMALLFAGLIEGLYWRHLAVALRPRDVSTTPPTPTQAASDANRQESGHEESYPANLVQQIVRTREASGEAIHAVLRAEFQPGEQVQVLHVAFCPPLSTAPELTAFAADDLEATVRVTNSYSFGVRVEVQLAKPADVALNLMVEVSGQT